MEGKKKGRKEGRKDGMPPLAVLAEAVSTYTTPWQSKRSRNAAAAMRAPDGKVTKWERDVLHTPMMNLIGEYLCCFSELLEQSEVLALLMFLRCSRTTSGRKLDVSGVPVFRTLERFHQRILYERFEEGMPSSEVFPTP